MPYALLPFLSPPTKNCMSHKAKGLKLLSSYQTAAEREGTQIFEVNQSLQYFIQPCTKRKEITEHIPIAFYHDTDAMNGLANKVA